MYRVLLHFLALLFLRPILEGGQGKCWHHLYLVEEMEVHKGSGHAFAELVCESDLGVGVGFSQG